MKRAKWVKVGLCMLAATALCLVLSHSRTCADGDHSMLITPPPPPVSPKPPVPIPNDVSYVARLGSIADYGNKRINSETGFPARLSWAYSLEDAQKAAKEKGEAYAIFFCSAAHLVVSGESDAAFLKYKQEHGGVLPEWTPFDNGKVVCWFYARKIHQVVKLGFKENVALAQKFNARENTIVLCTPDGEKLDVVDARGFTVATYLRQEFQPKFDAWKARQAALKGLSFKPPAVEQVLDARLYGAFRFGQRIYSGCQPQSNEGFAALKELRVGTVISVSAKPPDLRRLEPVGIRGVHLPLAYSAITTEQALALAKAVKDLPGPVYIQCETGLMRAPAAAALAGIVLGDLSSAQALEGLKQIGVPESFKGLYAAVLKSAQADPDTLAQLKLEFRPALEVSALASAMHELLRVWQPVDKVGRGGWRAPDFQPELEVHTTSQALVAAIVSVGGSVAVRNEGEKFLKDFRSTETAAADFVKVVNAWKRDGSPVNRPELKDSFDKVSASCVSCHTQRRDNTERWRKSGEAK